MAGAYAILDALASIVDAPVAMAAAIVDGDTVDEAYDLSNEESRFEFASITKTMTAYVLASLALDGAVALDDPIGSWLDAGSNGAITFRELATHTSGLPRLSPNATDHDGFDPRNPYASFTAELAEVGLRVARRDDVGAYSNFGMQLLGLALERVAGAAFETLLRDRVFEPCGMTTATVGPGPHQVQGYMDNAPTPAWTGQLVGDGGVCGTLCDLVAWGRAVLRPTDAMRLALDNELAWQRSPGGLLWHNGGTYGAHACLALDREAGRFAATLVATGDLEHVDDATFVACRGGDPFDTRPRPVEDEHARAAVAIVELMAAHKWNQVRDRMTRECAKSLTKVRLSLAWKGVMGPRGDYRAARPRSASTVQGATMVSLDLAFARGDGAAQVYFDEANNVVGLRIQ